MARLIAPPNKSFLSANTIQQTQQINDWQISEIKKGLIEADRGELIEHAEAIRKYQERIFKLSGRIT